MKRIITIFLAALAVAGCAAQSAYRAGKDLAADGRVEDALEKFKEAMNRDPRELAYKIAYIQTRERASAALVERAGRSVASGDTNAAETLYLRVLTIDPDNDSARAGLRALEAGRRHANLISKAEAAWEKKDADRAQMNLRSILSENPHHPRALALQRAISEASVKTETDPALSAAYKKPITIEFKEVPLKQVFEVLSRTSGLNFLFDKDVRLDQKTSIFLKNSTIAAAVNFTLLTNQLEQQVLDGNTILVYPNTPAKLKDYQSLVVKSFFLANADAKTVANSLKTIVKSRDVVVDEKLNMLIVRDSPEAIRLAEKLVHLHDIPEPEVMLEVEILEVKRSRLFELGVKWPASLSLAPLPSSAGGAVTLRDLRSNLNSGTIGATVAPITVNARTEDADANILANPRIRARNHEKAKILIGDRVPNITSTATATGFVSESVNYVDVGLKLEVEPSIHLDNDVAIKVSLEVSNIVSQIQTKSGTLAYQIGTRTASTVLRLRDGENQVLAGLINDEDRRSGSKIPGLGEIPIVGRLFGDTLDNNQKTEIVLSITPRLIRNIQRPEAAFSEFNAGTEGSLRAGADFGSGPSADVPAMGAARKAVSYPARPLPPIDHAAPPTTSTGLAENAPIAVSTGAVGSVQPAPTGLVQLRWQGDSELQVGSTHTLQLTISTEQPIVSLPMVVNFDDQILQVVSVTEGDFLKQNEAPTSFSSRVEPGGKILMTGTRSGQGGARGSGIVANVTFRALRPAPASAVQLSTVSPVDASGRYVSAPPTAPHTYHVQP